MLLRRSRLALALQTLLLSACARPSPEDGLWHFQTEPTFWPLKMKVLEMPEDRSLLEPGYIFFAPFPKMWEPLTGPHIVDQDGELVWYGNSSTRNRVQDFNVCSFQGTAKDHLCWSETTWGPTKVERSYKRIFDNTYQPVGRDYGRTGLLDAANPHEFNVLPDGKSYLKAVYQITSTDLQQYGGPKEGYFLDGCFQEVDLASGEEIFSWCAKAHVGLWESYIFPPANKVNFTGEEYGLGTTQRPWDYLHLNAVDKNEEGDYFLSARHMDQIIKVAGNNNVHGVEAGTILWRLGGKQNDFADESTADLSRQHHVRHISTTATETRLSLFNNQWEANGTDGRRISNGQILVLNNETMTVTHVQKHYNPEGILSLAQGSMQPLPNGNSFIGWGAVAQVSEFAADGTTLFHAHLAEYTPAPPKGARNVINYRAFKAPWVGRPTTPPKLVAYAHNCSSNASRAPLLAYVSWNGATEVAAWRFRTSDLSRHGPWLPAGTAPKTGFETKAALRGVLGGPASFARYVAAEALDASGNTLPGSHVVAETFVPGAEVAEGCDADGCFKPLRFEYTAEYSCGAKCARGGWLLLAAGPLMALVGVVVLFEAFHYLVVRRRRQQKGILRLPGYERVPAVDTAHAEEAAAWEAKEPIVHVSKEMRRVRFD